MSHRADTESLTPWDYQPRHRAEPKHRAEGEPNTVAEHDPVPCHHHQFMLARHIQILPCPNLSERGSLYCTEHQQIR